MKQWNPVHYLRTFTAHYICLADGETGAQSDGQTILKHGNIEHQTGQKEVSNETLCHWAHHGVQRLCPVQCIKRTARYCSLLCEAQTHSCLSLKSRQAALEVLMRCRAGRPSNSFYQKLTPDQPAIDEGHPCDCIHSNYNTYIYTSYTYIQHLYISVYIHTCMHNMMMLSHTLSHTFTHTHKAPGLSFLCAG